MYKKFNPKFIGVTGALLLLTNLGLAAEKGSSITGTTSVKNKSKSEYASLAKIAASDAMKTAEKEGGPGSKVVEISLEEENNYLIYSANIVSPQKGRSEIIIDAGNGKVLDRQTASQKDHEDDDDDRD